MNKEVFHQIGLFLETVNTSAPAYYPFFLCLARTGMRLGEALALQWGDIDFRSRFIEVRRNYFDNVTLT